MSLNLEGVLADIKRAALEAVLAAKPFSLTYGTVINANPLQITVDQKLTLYAEQLILTNSVRDYTVEMTVNHVTENALSDTNLTHAHSYLGRKCFTVHLALKKGEQVILFRADGGQKYIVLDRVGVQNDTAKRKNRA